MSRGYVARGDELEASQWVIVAAAEGGTVRFEAPPVAPGGCWVEVRALTHREALERESIGGYEEYELSDGGRVLSVVRRCDRWAMAEYDYQYSLVDWCLPVRQFDGSMGLQCGSELAEEERVDLLAAMPPALAEWVEECIDRVNLRNAEGEGALEDAKKKRPTWCAEPAEDC